MTPNVIDGVWEISPFKKKRSNGQNRHFHGIVLPQVSKAMSEMAKKKITNALAKEILKYKFLKDFNETYGTIVLPTSRLSTVQWMKFLEDIQRYAAEVLHISVENPNEESYGKMN